MKIFWLVKQKGLWVDNMMELCTMINRIKTVVCVLLVTLAIQSCKGAAPQIEIISSITTQDGLSHHGLNKEQAIVHLKKGLRHWEKYAEVGQKQYKSQLLSRAGAADWQKGYENAKKDILLLEEK